MIQLLHIQYSSFTIKIQVYNSIVKIKHSILKFVPSIFKIETSDIGLLDSLCDVNTERKNGVRQKYLKWLWRKKSHLTWSIVIKLPVVIVASLRLKNERESG